MDTADLGPVRRMGIRRHPRPTSRYHRPMSARIRVLVVLALVFWGREAHLSQTHYQAIPLDEVTDRATLIVVARPATPPSVTKPISITPRGKQPSDKYPPFPRVQTRWTVVEVLKGAA